MADQWNDCFLRLSDILSNCLSTTRYQQRTLSKTVYLKWFKYQTRYYKNVHCFLKKICLHLQTVCWSQASRFSPTVQLDFSWTFQISIQQNNWFGKPSDSLSSSQSTVCHRQSFEFCHHHHPLFNLVEWYFPPCSTRTSFSNNNITSFRHIHQRQHYTLPHDFHWHQFPVSKLQNIYSFEAVRSFYLHFWNIVFVMCHYFEWYFEKSF